MNNQVLSEDIKLFALNFKLSEQLRDKTFLITGATGLIGSVMVKCLLELNRQMRLGIKIIAVVRNLDKAKMVFADEYSQVDFLQLELSEITPDHIEGIVDYVVHLASPTASKYFVDHPVETLRTAVEGTTAVLEFAKAANVKSMVFASSLEVYGSNSDHQQIDESFQGYVNPVEVRSSYNIGKRTAECLCHSYYKEYNVPVKIARLTQTTGAGIAEDDNRIIVQFACLAAQSKDIVLHTTGESARPYCYTTDAVSALLYILLKGENGEAYNVANEETYISACGMAEYVKKFVNSNINVRVELNDNMGYAPVTKLCLSTAKLRNLGWSPQYGLKDIFYRLTEYLGN